MNPHVEAGAATVSAMTTLTDTTERQSRDVQGPVVTGGAAGSSGS